MDARGFSLGPYARSGNQAFLRNQFSRAGMRTYFEGLRFPDREAIGKTQNHRSFVRRANQPPNEAVLHSFNPAANL